MASLNLNIIRHRQAIHLEATDFIHISLLPGRMGYLAVLAKWSFQAVLIVTKGALVVAILVLE